VALPKRVAKRFRGHGFDEVRIESGVYGALPILGSAVAGECNEVDGVAESLSNSSAHLIAVDPGKPNVDHGHLRPGRAR
jgi:hypothetical protein